MNHNTYQSSFQFGRLWRLAAGTCLAVALLVTNVACNGQISKDAELKSLLSASQLDDCEKQYWLGSFDEMTDEQKTDLKGLLLKESNLLQESKDTGTSRAQTVPAARPMSAEKQSELRRLIENAFVLSPDERRYWLNVLPQLTAEQERELRRIASNNRYEVGLAAAQRGNHLEAVQFYELSLEADPTNLAAHNGLAWLLATSPLDQLRNGKLAVKHARAAIAISPSAFYKDTLAAALAESGDFEAARELQDQILPEFDREELLRYRLNARRRSAAYHSKRAWVEVAGEGGPRKP